MTGALLGAAAVPGLVAVVVVGFRNPLRLLALYALVVPFGSAVSLPLGLPAAFSSVSTLVGMAAAVAMALHLALGRARGEWLQPTVPIWLMFFGITTATFVWSIASATTLRDLVILGSLVALYACAGFMRPREHDLGLIERALVLGGGLTGLYALVLLVTDSLPTPSGAPRFEVVSGGGESGDPNITAASLLLPFFVALGRGTRADGVGERAASLAAAALSAVAVLLTASRGALLAMIIGTVVIAVAGRGRRGFRLLVAPMVVLVLAYLVAPAALQAHLFKPTSSGRTGVWAIGLDACRQHCALGAGWGTFPDVHSQILLDSPDASGTRLRFVAHSIWLQAAVETGVLGLLLLIAAFTLAFGGLRRLPPHLRAPPVAALAGLALTNTFLSNLDFKYFWLVFIHVLVVTQVHGNPSLPRPPSRIGQPITPVTDEEPEAVTATREPR